MSFSIPTFALIKNTIVQEIRNITGLTVPLDSDASIRADGTASAIEGLYSHQTWILRQLFAATADEPFLYLHAARAGVPRLGGTAAAGTVTASANVAVTIPAGSKLTDGKGHYWSSVADVALAANQPAIINLTADQVGSVWNYSGTSLNWISPLAGVKASVNVISINGGSDSEALEAWRARIMNALALGRSRDRKADLKSLMKSVPGVYDAYIFPKRRGLGSMDVAITATGTPPTAPSPSLIATAQAVLDAEAGFWADCRVFSPSLQPFNVTAAITGNGYITNNIQAVIYEYLGNLAPGETYQSAVLASRILQVTGVTDVQLTPATNQTPTVDWMHVYWFRPAAISVVPA